MGNGDGGAGIGDVETTDADIAIVAEVMEEECDLCAEVGVKTLDGHGVCQICSACEFCGWVYTTWNEAADAAVFETGKERDKFGCEPCVADAKKEYESEHGDSEDGCSGCSGSGEGSYDGSSCSLCGGSGDSSRPRGRRPEREPD